MRTIIHALEQQPNQIRPNTEFARSRLVQIAVKTLLPIHLSSEAILNDFKQEVEILSKLNHTCLVSFVGAGIRIDPGVRTRPFAFMCHPSSPLGITHCLAPA